MELICEVLLVGGGCGGVAAALAVSDMGRELSDFQATLASMGIQLLWPEEIQTSVR